jgi:hypothetical protein
MGLYSNSSVSFANREKALAALLIEQQVWQLYQMSNSSSNFITTASTLPASRTEQ